MPEIKLEIPEPLLKRLQAEADIHALTPELMAMYFVARFLREEKPPTMTMPDPRMMVIPFMRGSEPQPQENAKEKEEEELAQK